MPLTVTHPYVSSRADSSDTTLVNPSNWNAIHTISGTLPSSNISLGPFTANQVVFASSTTTASGMSGTVWDDVNRSLAMGGATVTANIPIFDLTQTWNSSTVTFTGLRSNITDTQSAATSLLIDLQVGSVSQFNVDKTGNVVIPQNRYIHWNSGGTLRSQTVNAQGLYTFGNNNETAILTLVTVANNTWQFGGVDTGSPVSQTMQVQNVQGGAFGATNGVGADWIFAGSKGTGTGGGGNIVFQTAVPSTTSGKVQNTEVEAGRIDHFGNYWLMTKTGSSVTPAGSAGNINETVSLYNHAACGGL